jgi:hypothetical protein
MQSNQSSVNPIPLGDAIEHFSKCLYAELDSLLSNMRLQNDPEYRTKQLRSYLLKARKIICQLHCICSWLKNPSVTQSFSAAAELKFQLQGIRDSIAIHQDNLFYVHRDIFPKRSRRHEVDVAKHLLAVQTYSMLPDAVAHMGQSAPPALLDKTASIDDLTLFIHAKLLLNEVIPADLQDCLVVADGKLVIVLQNVYSLHLTLSHLHETADWIVLGCQSLICSNKEESFYGTYDRFASDRDLLEVVRYYSTPSLPSEAVTSHTTIAKYHMICNHMMMAIALRLFYLQALDMSRTLWKGFMEVEFNDVGDNTNMKARFWKAQITRLVLHVCSLDLCFFL